MSKGGFFKNGKNPLPPNAYRTGIRHEDFRRAMEDKGPLSLTQIAGLLSDRITPEAKARYYKRTAPQNRPIAEVLAVGARRICQISMRGLIKAGKVCKHGSGAESRYEWVAGEVGRVDEDSAGR